MNEPQIEVEAQEVIDVYRQRLAQVEYDLALAIAQIQALRRQLAASDSDGGNDA